MVDLASLIEKYRRGRDGFDGLALAATRLYLSGVLLPAPDDETPLEDRVRNLSSGDLERALDGNLGTEPMSREEFQALLADTVEFLKEWIGSDEGML